MANEGERCRFAGLSRDEMDAYIRLAGSVNDAEPVVEVDGDVLSTLLSNDDALIADGLAQIEQDDEAVLKAWRAKLATIMLGSEHSVPERASAGRAVAHLGDPRESVYQREPDMVHIPAGDFFMGDEEEGDTYTVTIDQPYEIGLYPVTNAQYRHFIEDGGYTKKHQKCWPDAGWEFREEKSITQPRFWDDVMWNLDNHPVVGVSWYECIAYAAWLAKVTRKPYRLPTEAEWERAARHTDGRIYPWGNEWQSNHANTNELQLGETTAVGIFPVGNAVCGAADMSGNVWEWCLNKYENPDIVDVDQSGDFRTLRGGSWGDDDSRYYRVAVRDRGSPYDRFNSTGVRVVCVLPSHRVR